MIFSSPETGPSAGASPRQSLIFGWFIILLFEALLFLVFHGTWALDLTALYFAAHFYDTGQFDLVYLPGSKVFFQTPPPEYAALAAAQGQPDAYLTPYIYPPLWAALLAPLVARVSAQAFFTGFLVVNMASFAGMIWLTWRLVAPEKLSFLVWAVLSLALIGITSTGVLGFWLNQPQIFISFLTLLAFVLLFERRDVGAGAVLALAAAMKLSPIFLVLIFVAERRWRALASFAVVGGGLALTSVGLAGWPLHEAFLTKLSAVAGQIYITRIVAGLELLFYQLGTVFDGTASWAFFVPYDVAEPVWIGWAIRVVLVAGLAACLVLTRHLPERSRLFARLFSMSIVILVTNPLPWIHYLFLPLTLLPGFVLFLPVRRMVWLSAGVAVALSWPLYLWASHIRSMAFPQAGLHLVVALGLLGLVLALSARAGRD